MEYRTNTVITETHVQVNLRWDPSYIKTLPGGLKAGVIVSDRHRHMGSRPCCLKEFRIRVLS